LRLSSTR